MNNLFDKISARANYADPETVTEVYYAMVKVIIEGIKKEGEIKLPNWGTFKYVENKPKVIRNIQTGELQTTSIRKMIKFVPCKYLKDYVAIMK